MPPVQFYQEFNHFSLQQILLERLLCARHYSRLVGVHQRNKTGKDIANIMEKVGITANKNTVPNDPQSPFVTSGVRLGSAAVTTRGFKEAEMHLIAKWIKDITVDFEGNKDRVLSEVQELCSKYPIY